ncbi:hypothetical protein HOY82DRAFT_477332, partial [Tuber indicum]
IFDNRSRNPQVDSALSLAVVLYIMGQLGNYTVRFGEHLQSGEGTAYLYRRRVMTALLRPLPSYLILPKPGSEDYRTMRRKIEQDIQFPGLVGFLDGTDVGLMYAPSFLGEVYMNREKIYALNMQAACDINLHS